MIRVNPTPYPKRDIEEFDIQIKELLERTNGKYYYYSLKSNHHGKKTFKKREGGKVR